jgi:hypothetical protein
MERLGESELFGPIIQLPGIGADDLAARSPSHFLEHGIGKKNLIGIVRDDDTIVQCFENGPHLLEPLRFFAPQDDLLMPNCSNREGLRAQLTASLTLLSLLQNKSRKSVDTIHGLVFDVVFDPGQTLCSEGRCIASTKARGDSEPAELVELLRDNKPQECSVDNAASVALPYLW